MNRDQLILTLGHRIERYQERALRAEALVREKDEAISELLTLVDRPMVNGWQPGIDFCTCWDIGRSCNCYCGYEARRTRPAI